MRFPFGLYRVSGQSMSPAYQPGDMLLGARFWRRLTPGVVVVAQFDGRPVIKRIDRLSDGQVWLVGDNAAVSTDSRQYGPVPITAIEAIILARRRRWR